MAQYHVKNGSFLGKAFKVWGGHQVVPAGCEAEVPDAKELSEAQIEALAQEGVKVTSTGAEVKAKPQKGDPPVSALDALAAADGNFMAFKSSAKDVLGDATPSKKDEIVAALIAKLTDTELKTFLGARGVEVKDETRDQLEELAKAA
ncbi:hypothetical protein GCM10011321_14700 [Youhaiella tibetensis]|uniref:Uncharacterized protein n=1 Tax=Paradevosia tibetensis TaxID=1447062 RepID=A0A5B9DNL9_9HYPH|nr:hypothetical protein [Youhaiella tibetensis]QEE20414.1 hypothetical protein FNA67_09605 [Youhaiella tibetensis]GGF24378.1 hypothetical protein GCM10011321_14700 [Youhaiella tibetensis]